MIKRQSNRHHKKADRRDKDSGDSSGEETELFVRHKSLKREIPTVEKTIEENDTLQSLAIRHHCTIEDLKRLNNIHKENEIYARRTIRVPYRPFAEALAPIHVSGSSSPREPPTSSNLIDIDSLQSKLDTVDEVNQIIFNSSISNREPDQVSEDSVLLAEEDVDLLPQQASDFVRPDPVISGLSCNGSDWDISYPALIVCIVLVIFAIPLIYVFYIAEHPEIYHNHTHLNAS